MEGQCVAISCVVREGAAMCCDDRNEFRWSARPCFPNYYKDLGDVCKLHLSYIRMTFVIFEGSGLPVLQSDLHPPAR